MINLSPCEHAFGLRNTARILVVEDEFFIRMLLSDELRDAGYYVIEASSADEALVLLASVIPDAIISDVRMPGSLDGLDLLSFVRETFRNLPVIIMSGDADPQAAIEAGASKFFAKPFKAAEMIDAVRCELENIP